ncbi:hypothetical protein CSKR_113785 [Clonorchis sinensis]|uniref:Uncharacterized protein n=1 Tax=Clonorchis sinensis TaxID=79923 RepID=A0A8T1MC32_CLOSI|nr:hypothetical protein CSKR_113785 [Clonorchis sinensis]
MDGCPACVVEKIFDGNEHLRTNRFCKECPLSRITVTNNNRTVNDCCKTNLCLGSSSGTNVQKIPPADTSNTPTGTNIREHITVADENESITERPTDELYTKPTAGNATQQSESLSPVTCHISAWYLAFSTSFICAIVACFN